MNPALPLMFICSALLLAGCDSQTAEQGPVRFKQEEMDRFEMTLERTPADYPNVFLVRDSKTGSEILLFTSNEGRIAACVLPQKDAKP